MIHSTRSTAAAVALALGLCLPFSASAQQADEKAALTQRLFQAVRSNDIATVRLVLTNGADPMAVDANGQTPAGIAIDRGYFDIAHHILGVRNQRQALQRRDSENERNAPASAGIGGVLPSATGIPSTFASAPPQERRPEPTWRDNAVPGQAAEIPAPRISSPKEAVVIQPAMVPGSGPTAARAAAATAASQGKAQAKAAPAAATNAKPNASAQPAQAHAATQAALTNLPSLPPGAPNPFDPAASQPAALPVLASTPATAPAATEQPRETSSGNALSRFFNGITGVFGGGGS